MSQRGMIRGALYGLLIEATITAFGWALYYLTRF